MTPFAAGPNPNAPVAATPSPQPAPRQAAWRPTRRRHRPGLAGGVARNPVRELGMLEDVEVAVVEMLMGGEAVAGFEEEVGCVVVPGAAGVDEACSR